MSLPYAEADRATVCLCAQTQDKLTLGKLCSGEAAAYFKLSGDEMVPTNSL